MPATLRWPLERHWQPAGGIDVAEQRLADGGAAALPGYQLIRIAGRCDCAQSTAMAEPPVSTITTGLPVACRASSRVRCGAGNRSRYGRHRQSPDS